MMLIPECCTLSLYLCPLWHKLYDLISYPQCHLWEKWPLPMPIYARNTAFMSPCLIRVEIALCIQKAIPKSIAIFLIPFCVKIVGSTCFHRPKHLLHFFQKCISRCLHHLACHSIISLRLRPISYA